MARHRSTFRHPKLALAAFVAAAVVAVELVARARPEFVPGSPTGRSIQATAQFDAEIGWINRSDLRTQIVSPFFRCDVTLNANGLRDREHAYRKPPGCTRIVLLGDSMCWGWGVDDGVDFASIVEAELAPGVEVVNLSVPGYSTDQELLLLEREGWRYEPDYVLLCFVLNDVIGNESVRGIGMPGPKPRFVVGPNGELALENSPVPKPRRDPWRDGARWIQRHSALAQWMFPFDPEARLARAHAAVDRARSGTVFAGDRVENERYRAIVDAAADGLLDSESVTYRLIERLAQRCAERSVELLGFTLCSHHDRYLYAADFAPPDRVRERDGAFRTRLAQRFAELGSTLGFRTFSVDDALLAAVAAHGDLHCGDGHLNAVGNRTVAERIATEFRDLWAARQSSLADRIGADVIHSQPTIWEGAAGSDQNR